MADLSGANNTPNMPSDLGNLAFSTNDQTPNTLTNIRISDSVGLYSELSELDFEIGTDPFDYFFFLPSGVGSVSVTVDSFFAGTYANALTVIPLFGVTSVNGDTVGYRDSSASGMTSNPFAADSILAGAEVLYALTQENGVQTNADISQSTFSRDGDAEMSAVWLLDGSPVIFEVTGYQAAGSDQQAITGRDLNVSEVAFDIEITPLDAAAGNAGPGSQLFVDNTFFTETHLGGDAVDIYRFDGTIAELNVLSRSGDQIIVANQADMDTQDTLIGIERIETNDGTIAFDTDGNAGQIYRIYQAAFDRDPDVGGLGHWIRTFDNGIFDLTGVAQEFLISQEFQLRFGTEETLDDNGYLTLLYNNVLDRDPDQAGFDFWSDQQAMGLGRAEMLQFFSESPENFDNVAAEIDAGIFYV